MAFEVFDKRKSALDRASSATLQKKGILSLNNAAHKLIKYPQTVELLYDRETQTIALRESTEAHAYAFRIANESTGQVIVSLTAFTEYYGIDTSCSKRLTPYLDGETLCMELAEGVVISGNRTKR